ncbi:MAG: acetate/propionate family kinase [Verrucomicrobiota bacterium]
MKVAVINCGSSSIKYELFAASGLVRLADGLVENIGSADGGLRQRRWRADGTFDELRRARPLADHREGFELMMDANRGDPLLPDASDLAAIGHRVVHGGERFHEPALVDDGVVAALKELIPLAPLHNPSNILGIEVARSRFPGVPQVAVFDTAFHHTLPPRAFRYAVPGELYTRHQVRRYGFHGISHAYLAAEASRHLGKPPEEVNLVTFHLGNGASAAAVRGGRSVDTSMGMTPLEGLVMGTRCGDVDPALPFHLMRHAGMDAQEVEALFETRSGLRGICGTNDMREILEQAATGNEPAGLAVEIFCYRIRKYLGAYLAVLGAVDAVVFSGGIGENAPAIRERACDGLERLGISIDAAKNASARGVLSEIQTDAAPVKVLVIRTDEEREIARRTLGVVQQRR